MRQILDLHIHSKYSRACSPQLTLENIAKVCATKGVDIVATGDFTFPAWLEEIKNKLVEIDNSGLYCLKENNKTKFVIGTELSLVYKDGGKARRIHLVVIAPQFRAAKELAEFLDQHYNVRSDGRPILGMSAVKLVELCLQIDPRFLIIPAHIWTPWYAVFGSKSGFNSLEECFHEQTKNIFAIETGLSSDPAMNWRLSALDNLTILSNSDAHSLNNIGREANIFELDEISYDEIYQAIKTKNLDKIKQTLEFYPEEGMYHVDGHRACNFSCLPEQTAKLKNICPVCKKPLIIGVLNRVNELADRPEGFKPAGAVDFVKLVELDKIIAESLGIKSRQSTKVQAIYQNLIKNLGSELDILLTIDLAKISEISGEKIAEGVRRVRVGQLTVKPGFDGQYGEIEIYKENKTKQSRLL